MSAATLTAATLTAAKTLVVDLQSSLVEALTNVASRHGDETTLDRVEWKRDEGRHGGGSRYVTAESPTYNRVAVNVSHVHYDDMPEKRPELGNRSIDDRSSAQSAGAIDAHAH